MLAPATAGIRRKTVNLKRALLDGVSVFSISLIVSMLVTFLWNLAVHRRGVIDWETSVRFALLLGIIVPWIERRKRTG